MATKHSIALDHAKKMTRKFRDQKENIMSGKFKGKKMLPQCETFDRACFDQLLAQDDCTGVRVYFGINDDDQVNLVIVGVNSKNEDILPGENEQPILTGGKVIIEDGTRCPDQCPPSSSLNS
jgi:hypothetical protein